MKQSLLRAQVTKLKLRFQFGAGERVQHELCCLALSDAATAANIMTTLGAGRGREATSELVCRFLRQEEVGFDGWHLDSLIQGFLNTRVTIFLSQ